MAENLNLKYNHEEKPDNCHIDEKGLKDLKCSMEKFASKEGKISKNDLIRFHNEYKQGSFDFVIVNGEKRKWKPEIKDGIKEFIKVLAFYMVSNGFTVSNIEDVDFLIEMGLFDMNDVGDKNGKDLIDKVGSYIPFYENKKWKQNLVGKTFTTSQLMTKFDQSEKAKLTTSYNLSYNDDMIDISNLTIKEEGLFLAGAAVSAIVFAYAVVQSAGTLLVISAASGATIAGAGGFNYLTNRIESNKSFELLKDKISSNILSWTDPV